MVAAQTMGCSALLDGIATQVLGYIDATETWDVVVGGRKPLPEQFPLAPHLERLDLFANALQVRVLHVLDELGGDLHTELPLPDARAWVTSLALKLRKTATAVGAAAALAPREHVLMNAGLRAQQIRVAQTRKAAEELDVMAKPLIDAAELLRSVPARAGDSPAVPVGAVNPTATETEGRREAESKVPTVADDSLTETEVDVLRFLHKQNKVARTNTYIADNMPADKDVVGAAIKRLVSLRLAVTRKGAGGRGTAISDDGIERLRQLSENNRNSAGG
jgi:hypothetical protein